MQRYMLILLAVVMVNSASGVVIQGIESDKDSYAKGDLIHLTLYTNARDLEVIADFTPLDSGFSPGMVLVEESQEFSYDIWYPITFKNTRADKSYNVLISVYEKATDTSSLVSYAITLDNTLLLNRSADSAALQIRVGGKPRDDKPIELRNITDIKVEDGKIVVCSSDGCEVLTEDAYEKARRIIINEGQVELSGLTYNQLKGEISTDVTEEVNAKVQQYVSQIVLLNRDLQNMANNVQVLISDSQKMMINQSNQTKRALDRALYSNIAAVVIALFVVTGGLYVLYLRTETTWLK